MKKALPLVGLLFAMFNANSSIEQRKNTVPFYLNTTPYHSDTNPPYLDIIPSYLNNSTFSPLYTAFQGIKHETHSLVSHYDQLKNLLSEEVTFSEIYSKTSSPIEDCTKIEIELASDYRFFKKEFHFKNIKYCEPNRETPRGEEIDMNLSFLVKVYFPEFNDVGSSYYFVDVKKENNSIEFYQPTPESPNNSVEEGKKPSSFTKIPTGKIHKQIIYALLWHLSETNNYLQKEIISATESLESE